VKTGYSEVTRMTMSTTTPGEIPLDECQHLLRSTELGRLAIIVDGAPYVVPISYRWTRPAEFDHPVALLRVRAGSLIERTLGAAALLVDEIDTRHGRAWSVLARGHLVRPDPTHATAVAQPWPEGHECVLCLTRTEITGRRFVARPGAAGVAVDTGGYTVEWAIAGAH
jgi:hypothetical protein